jgi:hypothetical protein
VIRAAFVARITRTAEALSALVPIQARLNGVDLARNLLEHLVCSAWIAADPDYPAGLAQPPEHVVREPVTHIYDTYSWMAHPILIGLQAFWSLGRSGRWSTYKRPLSVSTIRCTWASCSRGTAC